MYLLEFILFNKVILATVLLALSRFAGRQAYTQLKKIRVFAQKFFDKCSLSI